MDDHEAGSRFPTLTEQQVEVLRAIGDIHEMTCAIAVILVDAEGRSIAVSGDEAAVPPPVRSVLGGKKLAAAGSVASLLSPIAGEIAGFRQNVSIFAVDGAHVLAIVFDTKADLGTVEMVGGEARVMLAELLRRPLD